MKVALVYDRINKWGGAESVLLALHRIWPEAPLYTSVYDKNQTEWANDLEIKTSFLQQLPIPKKRHELYPFLMGPAFESFNFDTFDIVISVTHEFAKAIITKTKTFHLCYCLTPTSYLWSGSNDYFLNKSKLFKTVSRPIINYLRYYDQVVCHRPDKFLAISQTVQQRIKQYYHLNSEVVYPPITSSSKANLIPSQGQYYLIVSRLVPNKRIDLAIDAFNQLGWPLKIIGTGNWEGKLKSLAKANIEFLGHLTPGELDSYYSNCLALIVPGLEDFGLVALEAQLRGRGVMAFGKGGSTETVIEGKTGYFFSEQTAASLIDSLKKADWSKIKAIDCQKNAERFKEINFRKAFYQNVITSYEKWRQNYAV